MICDLPFIVFFKIASRMDWTAMDCELTSYVAGPKCAIRACTFFDLKRAELEVNGAWVWAWSSRNDFFVISSDFNSFNIKIRTLQMINMNYDGKGLWFIIYETSLVIIRTRFWNTIWFENKTLRVGDKGRGNCICLEIGLGFSSVLTPRVEGRRISFCPKLSGLG